MEIEEEKAVTPHLLSDEIKYLIVHYKQLDFSDSETAEIVGLFCNRPTISRQTVKSVWVKFCETGQVGNLWSTIGRPSILTEEDFKRLEKFF